MSVRMRQAQRSEKLNLNDVFREDINRAQLYSKLWRGFYNIYQSFSSDFEATSQKKKAVANICCAKI